MHILHYKYEVNKKSNINNKKYTNSSVSIRNRNRTFLKIMVTRTKIPQIYHLYYIDSHTINNIYFTT